MEGTLTGGERKNYASEGGNSLPGEEDVVHDSLVAAGAGKEDTERGALAAPKEEGRRPERERGGGEGWRAWV